MEGQFNLSIVSYNTRELHDIRAEAQKEWMKAWCQVPRMQTHDPKDCTLYLNCPDVNRHSTVTPYRRPILPPSGTERQLGRSRSWTSSRRRSIPSFLCKLFLAAFPSLHEEKEFSQPDRGSNLDADFLLGRSMSRAFPHLSCATEI